MRIVLDTNVLVAGLLSPFGAPGQIVRLMSAGDLTLCLDARILSEYEEVLARPKFAFDPDAVGALLDFVAHQGEMIVGAPLASGLPDPDDEPFLEVALSSGADYLVTGNGQHFPDDCCKDVRAVSPAQFMGSFRVA